MVNYISTANRPMLCIVFLTVIGTMASAHRVFVYGTLKTDEPNYYLLTDKNIGKATFLGNATTVLKYPLIIATKYNIPFILDEPGTGNHIQGEVYEVDDRMGSRLDVLEDWPRFYKKINIETRLNEQEQQETIETLAYVIQAFKPELLQLPFHTDYHSEGPHGLKYLEYSKRIPGYDPRADILLNP